MDSTAKAKTESVSLLGVLRLWILAGCQAVWGRVLPPSPSCHKRDSFESLPICSRLRVIVHSVAHPARMWRGYCYSVPLLDRIGENVRHDHTGMCGGIRRESMAELLRLITSHIVTASIMGENAVAIAGLPVTVARGCSGLLSQCYTGCFAWLPGLPSNIGTGYANKKGLTYWHGSCLRH